MLTEYRVVCDITWTRSDGSVRTRVNVAPIGRDGICLRHTYTDLDTAQAAFDCAIEQGVCYEEHIDRQAARFPNLYDRVHMYNYRLTRRECTAWHE